MKRINKKGQALQNLSTIAIGVVALAIILIVAFLIMREGKGQMNAVVDLTDQAFNNEAVTFSNGTETTLAGSCFGVTCSTLLNGTGGADILSGNFSCAADQYTGRSTITVTIDGFNTPASSLILNYTCDPTDLAFNSTSTLQDAADDVPAWVPIIIITLKG